ncbi:ribonuclease HI family protein [Terriglobus aquaticus]|uniref:Ribonuclease HI family protein n=1 Tax=Terriglobus aquaticus TaxID=940139 RepID=A0ABW9KP37_9BACT|nr:ribonuclease HI family protein [Terriglobus aquaticus]
MGTRALFEEGRAPKQGAGGKTALAHCDGGARGNPGPAGYGAVITDEAGAKLAELSEYLGKRTNNYAEYSGLLGVLQWSLDHGVNHLRVVSDSELMVKQVQGRYKVNSPDLRPLFEEARRRIAKLDSFQITHALRHKNKDADRLANEAMDRGMGRAPQAVAPGRGDAEVRPRAGDAVPAQGRGIEPGGPERGSSNAAPRSGEREMLRGFVKDGVVHLLGGKTLPNGSFVKVIAE